MKFFNEKSNFERLMNKNDSRPTSKDFNEAYLYKIKHTFNTTSSILPWNKTVIEDWAISPSN
jgi:hypothetical protein